MKRRLITVGAISIMVIAFCAAKAGANIVSSTVLRPPKHVRHDRHFHPIEHPDPSRVPYIEHQEQNRWGGPWIGRRSYCESGNRWWASSAGVMVIIARDWWYGTALPATPRGVKVRSHYDRWRPVYRRTTYSNGAVRKRRIGRMRQHVRLVRHGHLDDGNPQSTWLAIRVSQRAVSGDGPPASWQCSL
jgi:hypothetical protein